MNHLKTYELLFVCIKIKYIHVYITNMKFLNNIFLNTNSFFFFFFHNKSMEKYAEMLSWAVIPLRD